MSVFLRNDCSRIHRVVYILYITVHTNIRADLLEEVRCQRRRSCKYER